MSPKEIVDLFLANSFPQADPYKLTLTSFFAFSEFLSIKASKLLLKAFENYALELLKLRFVPESVSSIIRKDLSLLYDYNIKEQLTQQDLVDLSALNEALESFPPHQPSRYLLQQYK